MRARRDRHLAAQALPNERKPWYQQVTTKVAGGIAVLVGLTTLIGNVMDLDERRQKLEPPPAPASAPAAAPTAPLPAPGTAGSSAGGTSQGGAVPGKIALQIARIVAVHDGTLGTTDWRFTVDVAGQPLFAFQQNDLDDTPGRNIAVPKQADATVRLPASAGVPVLIRGWRLSRLRSGDGAPDATGSGTLSADGSDVQVDVVAKRPEDGEFRFYLSSNPS